MKPYDEGRRHTKSGEMPRFSAWETWEQDARGLEHEIRGSLNCLSAVAEFLRSENRKDDLAATVARQTAHILRLVEGFGRHQSDPSMKRLDLRSLMTFVEDMAWPHAQRCGVVLTLALSRRPVWVVADETKLTQAIHNVVSNGIKYTPEHGRVTVTVRDDIQRGVATIEVHDTGIGIAAEYRDAIFAHAFQGPPPVHPHEGSQGLGLAIVKPTMQMHGGTVAVESDGRGCGSLFTLELPLAQPSVGVGRVRNARASATLAHLARARECEANRQKATA